jgi:hypothetical protein|tara:strand:+ start:102 stop:650 length:549 start_codon:yes stop_codon:yes gene_type:complete
MAKTWQEILDDPMYSGVISNIETSLTLAAQGSGTVGMVDQTAADYGQAVYSKPGGWLMGDAGTVINAAASPELSYLRHNPKTVMQVLAGSTAGLTPQQRQAVISGTIGKLGQKWGGTSQQTAGEVLQTQLEKLGEIESNKQGWLPNIVALANKMAESKNVDVGGLLSTVGQTMEDEWSPWDD